MKNTIYHQIHFVQYAFAFYSRFFFQRTCDLDSFFSRLTFKKPYLDLAEKIAKNIGKFRGMHIRLTDHSNKYDSSPKNIEDGQKYFVDTSLPLIVSTDNKDKIKTHTNIKCVFVDDIITEDFAKEFMSLPFHNEVVFGLISLHYADLTDISSLYRVINKIQPDEIYNLAAQSHVRISFDQPIYTANATGLGVLNLIEAVREINPKIKKEF